MKTIITIYMSIGIIIAVLQTLGMSVAYRMITKCVRTKCECDEWKTVSRWDKTFVDAIVRAKTTIEGSLWALFAIFLWPIMVYILVK